MGVLYNTQDYTNKIVGDFIVLQKASKRINDTHVYWVCQCIFCNEIIETRASRIQKLKCKCQKDSFLEFMTTSYKDRDGLHRGVYKKDTGFYEVSVSYNKKKYYLGAYKTTDEANSIAKFTYSFATEKGLLFWLNDWQNIWGVLTDTFNRVFEDNKLNFVEFIDSIWNMKNSDDYIDKNMMQNIKDFKEGFLS